ncbi:hypothetical protein N8H74_27975 [Pseudomonas sp. B2M1-30]|uniref:hypothetical protein n=1 Tax=Pseudomonas TaxID=286 RepID=UPI0021C56DB2|nr:MULTISPECIES: hypothetical protein [Pseudomonas]MCU0122109.1 hypothetical protein [Pseudomonas sp. B2M1-30]MCU7264287.1 hypothetical protein [Pseudomonas koreensis]
MPDEWPTQNKRDDGAVDRARLKISGEWPLPFFQRNESQGENMELKGFPNMPVVKLTDEQIAAGKAAAEKFKEKIASGEITITYPDKPVLQPGVIYHPSQPAQPDQPSDTPPLVAIDTPLTYDSRGTVLLKPQG